MCDCDNSPRAYWERPRTARKPHRCCECWRVIEPGETYRYISGIWDHGPDHFKQCHECADFCGWRGRCCR